MNILTITSIITSLLFKLVESSIDCLIYSSRTSVTVDLIFANLVIYYYLLFLIHYTVSLTIGDHPH